jgi:hypothetical protein
MRILPPNCASVERINMKSLTRRDLVVSGIALVPLCVGQQLVGQQPTQKLIQEGTIDPLLAMQLLIASRKQIVLCELALSKLTDDTAKRFAEMEIDEHKKLMTQLLRLGFEYQVPSINREPGSNEERDGSAATFMVDGRPLQSVDVLPLRLIHQVNSRAIATQLEETARLSGKDIARRFVESQLDAHYDLFDRNVVFHKYASSLLSSVLNQSREIIEKHIAICKNLRENLA